MKIIILSVAASTAQKTPRVSPPSAGSSSGSSSASIQPGIGEIGPSIPASTHSIQPSLLGNSRPGPSWKL